MLVGSGRVRRLLIAGVGVGQQVQGACDAVGEAVGSLCAVVGAGGAGGGVGGRGAGQVGCAQGVGGAGLDVDGGQGAGAFVGQ